MKDYKLVSDQDPGAFQRTIAELLVAGWELHGETQVSANGWFYQAMTHE